MVKKIERATVSFPIIFAIIFFPFIAKATDCAQYKVSPAIFLEIPKASVSVTQPDKEMDLLHGNVVSTLSEEYELGYEIYGINGGQCIVLKSVKIIIGYTNFDVQIDKRNKPGTCEFNAVKEHEYEHINAHLSVIEDERKDIRQSILDAANGVMPVFVESQNDIDSATNGIEKFLMIQPQIGLMRKKIYAEQEIRNKKVDLNDKGERIQRCLYQ